MVSAIIAPHPPIIVDEIGKKLLRDVMKTVNALRKIAKLVEEDPPETVVVISPHTPIVPQSFTIKLSAELAGDFSDFGCNLSFKYETDIEITEAIVKLCKKNNIELTPAKRNNYGLIDHGIMVPLYFLKNTNFKLVSISISLLNAKNHFEFGKAVSSAVQASGKKVLFIASGDLSHRLVPGAPAGYSPKGMNFDKRVVEIVNSGNLNSLLGISPEFAEEAGECGLRSFQALAGYLGGFTYTSNLLSYEGPFGVGYLVAYFTYT